MQTVGCNKKEWRARCIVSGILNSTQNGICDFVSERARTLQNGTCDFVPEAQGILAGGEARSAQPPEPFAIESQALEGRQTRSRLSPRRGWLVPPTVSGGSAIASPPANIPCASGTKSLWQTRTLRRWGSHLFIAFLLGVCFVSTSWAQAPLDGDWLGGWQHQQQWVSLKVAFKTEADVRKAVIDVQAVEGAKSFTVPVVTLDQQTFRLETTKDATAIVLEGKRVGAIIKGHWQHAGAQGVFELLRVAKVEAKLFDQYVGSYQLTPDNFIAIGRQSRTGQNPRLGYVERKSGRRGNLTPLSETEFIGGPALGLDYPANVRITFVKNERGEVEGLRWRHGNAAEQLAKSHKLKEENVTFPNGAHTLAGTLVLPPTQGPHPAIVLAHGSTPLHRHYFGPDPYMYPALGVAVLFYDKRGVGASTGARTEVISELAADLLAGVAYRKTRAEIDPKQIGLFGHSEGGWVVPEAAAHSKDIAFLIAGAAPGLPRQESMLYEMDSELRWAGFTEAERAQAKQLWLLRNDAMRTNGATWNVWREAQLKAKAERWFSLARTPADVREWNEANRPRLLNFIAAERRWGYDPVPAWERLTIPALVYESEWDKDVPGPLSATIIERALQKAGNKNFTVKVFPQSQHGQWAMPTENPNNKLAYRVDYDLLFGWLRKQIKLAK